MKKDFFFIFLGDISLLISYQINKGVSILPVASGQRHARQKWLVCGSVTYRPLASPRPPPLPAPRPPLSFGGFVNLARGNNLSVPM